MFQLYGHCGLFPFVTTMTIELIPKVSVYKGKSTNELRLLCVKQYQQHSELN